LAGPIFWPKMSKKNKKKQKNKKKTHRWLAIWHLTGPIYKQDATQLIDQVYVGVLRSQVRVLFRHDILALTDNLSKSPQQVSLSASEGQRIAKRTLESLIALRSDDSFDSLWIKLQSESDRVDVNDPNVPGKRKAPTLSRWGTVLATTP
jgi:hypothetical protein